jgi:PKD repeat protein
MKAFNKILFTGLVLSSLIFTDSNFPSFAVTSASFSDTKHTSAEINAGVWDSFHSLVGIPENLSAGSENLQNASGGSSGTLHGATNSESFLPENSPENSSSLKNESSLNNDSSFLTNEIFLNNIGSEENLTNNSSTAKNESLNLTNITDLNRTVSLGEARNNTGSLGSGTGSGSGNGSGSGRSDKDKGVLPEASFSSNVTSGPAPLTVHFTDLSQNASKWQWDFGDGASSSEQNTTHTYSTTGNYTVTLEVSNANGTDFESAKIMVLEQPEVVLPPVAGFTSSITTGPVPFSVHFTDLSQNASEWSWDFGDGINSSEQNPAHTYSATGIYTVTLTVNSTAGNNSEKKTDYIKVGTASSVRLTGITLDGENSTGATTGSGAFTTNPEDSFGQIGVRDENGIFFNQPSSSGTLGEISIPLQLGVNNLSLVADGIYPANENYGAVLFFNGITTPPRVAVYNSNGGTGTFSVQPAGTNITGSTEGNSSLDKAPGSSFYITPEGTKIEVLSFFVDSNKGLTDEIAGENLSANGVSDTIAKISLEVTPSVIIPLVSFSASPLFGKSPLNVSFTDSSQGSPTSWNWDFGDGAASTEQNPSHTYSAAGNYTAMLTVSNANGTNSTFTTITVLQPVLPIANFSSNVTSGTVPLTVQFTDLSQNAEEWNWDFEDEATSTEQNPSHTYSAAGNYKVTLTVSNEDGITIKTGEISVAKSSIDNSGNSSSENVSVNESSA